MVELLLCTIGATEVVLEPFSNESIEEVHELLDELHEKFRTLVRTFIRAFHEKATQNSQLATDASRWLNKYMGWPYNRVDNTLTDLFNKMRPYYNFFECTLLLDMSEEFLQDVTVSENGKISNLSEAIQSHSFQAKALLKSNAMSTFRKFLQQNYVPFNNDLGIIHFVHLHLQRADWEIKSINALYKLTEKLQPGQFLMRK